MKEYDTARVEGIFAATHYLEKRRQARRGDERPWWIAIGIALFLMALILIKNI